MLRKASLSLSLSALALVACRTPPPASPAPSPEVEARLAALEARLDRIADRLAPAEAAPVSTEPLAADDAARVTRLETRFEKVVAFLRQAVPPELDDSLVYALPVEALDPVIGPAAAPVTIVEVSEYLCPYCSMLEPTMEKLRAAYPTKVRVVMKYMVIHGEDAVPSGAAACAAGRQGKFEAYSRDLWAAVWPAPGAANREAAMAPALEALARTRGLDLQRFKADIADGGPCDTWVTQGMATLERFGVSGTPTLYINGRHAGNGRSFEELKALVDDELGAVARSGVPAARYYQDVVMAKGARAAVMSSPFD